MAWSPYSLLDAGFQLSFAAVGAIFVVVPRLQQTLAGYPVPHSLAEVVAVSGRVRDRDGADPADAVRGHPAVFDSGECARGSGRAPLLGIALVTAIVAPVAPPLASLLALVNGWLAAYLAACARVVGGLPYAAVSALAALVIAAVVLCAAYLVTRLGRPRGRAYAAIALGAALVAGGWRLHGAPPPPPPHGLRITFLDVGQGDGALIQVPGGAVLVDEGPPEAEMASQLRRLGVRTLSLLVLTHPQRDHVGGAAQVLSKLSVGAVLDPAIPSESPDERAARASARARGVRIIVARAGEAFRIGALRLRVLWPDGPGAPGDDPNNHAVVLVASYGQTDALFTADAESDVTRRLQLPPVEILKVAHHGSADAGLADELKQLRPRDRGHLRRRRQRLRASDSVDPVHPRCGPGSHRLPHRPERPSGRSSPTAGASRCGRVADYAWPRCPPSRCCRSISSPAATGRRSARAPPPSRALRPEAVEQLSAESASGADAVAACNALGLFGGRRRTARHRRRGRALAEGRPRGGRVLPPEPCRGRGARALRGSALARLDAHESRREARAGPRLQRAEAGQPPPLGGRRVQAAWASRPTATPPERSSRSSATTRWRFERDREARRLGGGRADRPRATSRGSPRPRASPPRGR